MRIAASACIILGASSFVLGQSPDSIEFFEKKIRPLFAARCVSCHNQKASAGGLDLSVVAAVARGGKSGPIVSKEDPARSRILEVTSHRDAVKMPPDGKLPDATLADLRAWVAAGAPMPDYKPTGNTAGFFEERIRPIFSTSCVACHNESLKTAGLDLSTPAAIVKGGRSGPVVSESDPDQSS
jgi:cytochrome c551/c552